MKKCRRIGNRQPLRVECEIGLSRMDIADEHRAVGALLHFDPV
jgi:hypothetical protein